MIIFSLTEKNLGGKIKWDRANFWRLNLAPIESVV